MGIITFSFSAFLSLPKQFVTVYLGVILEQSADGGKWPVFSSSVHPSLFFSLSLSFCLFVSSLNYLPKITTEKHN
jgi:hypothetical protein